MKTQNNLNKRLNKVNWGVNIMDVLVKNSVPIRFVKVNSMTAASVTMKSGLTPAWTQKRTTNSTVRLANA